MAGGLAERLRVEPALVRVAFVLLALCGGAGVLAYAVLWVSVPQAEIPVEALDAGPQRGGKGDSGTRSSRVLLMNASAPV